MGAPAFQVLYCALAHVTVRELAALVVLLTSQEAQLVEHAYIFNTVCVEPQLEALLLANLYSDCPLLVSMKQIPSP